MKHIITIFKNLGTIVILLFQIAYEATIDYLSTSDNTKNTKNKTAPHQYTPIDKVTKSYKRTRRQETHEPRYTTQDEQDESIEKSHKMVENLRKNFLV